MTTQTATLTNSVTADVAQATHHEEAASAPAIIVPKQMSIGQFLASQKKKIEAALPKHLTPDKLLSLAMTEIRKNPKLATCTQASLIGAILNAAQLGLEPGPLGRCYLIPYDRSVKQGNSWIKVPECQFQIGYKGMLDLIYRTGKVSSISVHEVYENDYYKYLYGINETCEHRPADGDRGGIKHFYIVVRFKDGGYFFDNMTVHEINAVRDKTKAYAKWIQDGKTRDAPIWVSDYVPMGKKTIIRRSFNYLPSSVEIQHAIALDEAADRGEQDNPMVIDGEFDYPIPEQISKSKQLEQRLST